MSLELHITLSDADLKLFVDSITEARKQVEDGIAAVLEAKNASDRTVLVRVNGGGPNTVKEFRALVRIDTPQEREYYRHGGILHYVLRQLKSRAASA